MPAAVRPVYGTHPFGSPPEPDRHDQAAAQDPPAAVPGAAVDTAAAGAGDRVKAAPAATVRAATRRR
jgi:hypothetical protein